MGQISQTDKAIADLDRQIDVKTRELDALEIAKHALVAAKVASAPRKRSKPVLAPAVGQ